MPATLTVIVGDLATDARSSMFLPAECERHAAASAGPAVPPAGLARFIGEQRAPPGSTTLAPGRPDAQLGKFGDRVRGDSRDRPQAGRSVLPSGIGSPRASARHVPSACDGSSRPSTATTA